MSSHNLFPGDVISVVSKMDEERECPCDVVIVRGSCIVNEALLTGESVPLVKEALVLDTSNSKHEKLSSKHKRSILFAGTKILQHECNKRKKGRIPVAPDGGAVGVVIRTSLSKLSCQNCVLNTHTHIYRYELVHDPRRSHENNIVFH